MKLPYYNPGRRSLTFSLILLLALTLLVLTGLGVFRLYFDFDWMAGESDTGQLFSLNVRGGQSFNLFEADSFGPTFWISLCVFTLLCIFMPMFRIPGGSLLAGATVFGLLYLHYRYSASLPQIPIEFELLTVLVLYGIYIMLSYIGEVRDRIRVHRLLSQYVPAELAKEYQRDPQALQLSGEEREISVLFCDVVGFSSVSEQLQPPQLADWLNMFFSHVTRIVVRYRGSIDKYMGDSVMAVWGAPTASQTHAYDALCAAMDMQTELESLNARYRERKLPEITMGIGISTGLAMVGPLGSEYRMDYTVVGDSVNVAQRLEGQTRKYQVPVIVSDRTAEALPDMLFRELDTVTVKGRSQPVTMFEPLGQRDQLSELALQRLDLHEQAMSASKQGDWNTAATLFSRLRDEWGPSSMYELYLRGIEQAMAARGGT
ncbi:MAG: adenylate/guanylate cyclase domain-containing protein [Granulosicoccus sp.]|nr:adenylate/guanylate cyclase domain-containing protein [Granulosicoccus sp.]